MIQTPHFKEREFQCPCCGKASMNPNFIYQLEAARTIAGIPFIISSGYRCLKHNATIRGSVAGSAHVRGFAADIKCFNNMHRHRILDAALRAGFTRIGIAPSFIHLDADPDKPQHTIWLYFD